MLEATIKETERQTVAYLTMHGPYDQVPDGYRRLYEWIDHYGLQPAGMPEAVFITVPDETPESEAQWELWAPVASGLSETEPTDDHIGVKMVAEETVASARHRGPYEEVGDTYSELAKWIADNGYTPVAPSREVYFSGPETPPEEVLTEIQIPVQRIA